jgi:hypothetical protein
MHKTNPPEIFNGKTDAWVEGFIGTVDIFHFKREYEDLTYRRYWELLGICMAYRTLTPLDNTRSHLSP